MFTRKEPKVERGLEDILAGFTTVRNQLASFINSKLNNKTTNESRIKELIASNQSIVQEVAKAENALDNINKILGE